MQEKRRATTRPAPPASGDGPFGAPGVDGAGLATVIHGTYAEALPVASMTVRDVRSRFQDLLDIHPAAAALLDGRPADDGAVVQAGQHLMFIRRAGEKGGARCRRR